MLCCQPRSRPPHCTLQASCLTILLLLQFFFCIELAKATIGPPVPPPGLSALRALWAAPLLLPNGPAGPEGEDLLRSGFKYEVRGRNWDRLVAKLITPGSNVSVVAFGGSVTVGHYSSCENSSWPEELLVWLRTAFPGVGFTLTNLGHGATTAPVAALCYLDGLSADADLVLLEYSANGCGGGQCLSFKEPGVYGFEQLMRRAILRAPRAALMSFAVFAFLNSFDMAPPNGTAVMLSPHHKAGRPLFMTGEDTHAVIARRYGVPTVSARDALYDLVFDEAAARFHLGMSIPELLKDRIHPRLPGARLYGSGLVAWGVRHMVTRELLAASRSSSGSSSSSGGIGGGSILRGSSSSSSALARASSGLPREQKPLDGQLSSSKSSGGWEVAHPLLAALLRHVHGFERWRSGESPQVAAPPPSPLLLPPALAAATAAPPPRLPLPVTNGTRLALETDSSWCVLGESLPTALELPPDGWSLVNDGRPDCTVPGCDKWGYATDTPGAPLMFRVDTTAGLPAAPAAALLARGYRTDLVLVHLKRHGGSMGIARLDCVTGCTCDSLHVDGNNNDSTAELEIARITVTPHPDCVVTLQVTNETSTGGHQFKLAALALLPWRERLRPGWGDMPSTRR